MDRRHFFLIIAALACIGGLFLWIGEIDLGMGEVMNSNPAEVNGKKE